MINHRASGEAVTHVEESKNGEWRERRDCEREGKGFRLSDKHPGNKNPVWGSRELREEKYNDSRKEE